ncbi:hypothetical protein JW721_03695 [Candidatus Micrarchaeota archaeon]|nr:hypothetical protein [Candidatus Micrarchaeota archaeon]
MAALMKRETKNLPLPGKKTPPRKVAEIFYARRQELNAKAHALPKAFSEEVGALYNNARKMRQMLKEQGIKVRSPEEVLSYFGTEALVKLEQSGTEISNPEEAAKSLGREALLSASASNKLNRSTVLQFDKITSQERLGEAEKLVYGLFLADLVSAHNFTLAHAVKFKAQNEISEECRKLNSLPHQTRLPHFWGMMFGAVSAAFAAFAATFMNKFQLGASLRESLTSGAAVFGAVLGGGALVAGKFFRTDKKLLHERLGKVSGNLEALNRKCDESYGILQSMALLQRNLLLTIGELGKRSANKTPQAKN